MMGKYGMNEQIVQIQNRCCGMLSLNNAYTVCHSATTVLDTQPGSQKMLIFVNKYGIELFEYLG